MKHPIGQTIAIDIEKSVNRTVAVDINRRLGVVMFNTIETEPPQRPWRGSATDHPGARTVVGVAGLRHTVIIKI